MKKKKYLGVPARKASPSVSASNLPPKTAKGFPATTSRARAQAIDPYGAGLFGATPEEIKTVTEIMHPLVNHFKIIEDIDWSYFALGHLSNVRNNLTAQEISENGIYHIKRIIRGKKKLGYDTSADEAKLAELAEFKALGKSAALGIGAKPTKEAVGNPTEAKRSAKSTGASRATPKRKP